MCCEWCCCKCCRRKKKTESEKQKDGRGGKASVAEKVAKSVASPQATSIRMPPREPVKIGLESKCLLTFAVQLYRWCSMTNSRKTMLAFPTAIQAAFAPYMEASRKLTQQHMRAAFYPGTPDTQVNDAMRTVVSAVSPVALDGTNRGWRLATRLYVQKKWMDAFCPEYRKNFESLNERCGKTMEMVPYDAAVAAAAEKKKKADRIFEDLNEWARRSIGFMERPLYENVDRHMQTFFMNKRDPRLAVINVCGFRCRFDHPFRAANMSSTGHSFVSYDGRKVIGNIPMLHTSEDDERTCYYCYFEDDKFQVLRLPIRKTDKSDVEMAIYVLLPKERGALRMLELNFSPAIITNYVLSCVQPERVRIILPKMQVECRYKNFVAAVSNFGAKSLLEPKNAELASMFAAEVPTTDHADMMIVVGKDPTKMTDPISVTPTAPATIKSTTPTTIAIVTTTATASTTPASAFKRGQYVDLKTKHASKVKQQMEKEKTTKVTTDSDNPCVTDAYHGGCFQLLDDEAEMGVSKSVQPTVIVDSKTVETTAIGSVSSSKTAPLASKTVEITALESKTMEASLFNSTAKSPPSNKSEKSSKREKSDKSDKSDKATTSTAPSGSKRSFLSRLRSFKKSGKSDKDKSKSERSGSGKDDKKSGKASSGKSPPPSENRSGVEEKKSRKKKSKMVDTGEPCQICTQNESRNVIPQLKTFVADHPFAWFVMIETPQLIPLVLGRYCGDDGE